MIHFAISDTLTRQESLCIWPGSVDGTAGLRCFGRRLNGSGGYPAERPTLQSARVLEDAWAKRHTRLNSKCVEIGVVCGGNYRRYRLEWMSDIGSLRPIR